MIRWCTSLLLLCCATAGADDFRCAEGGVDSGPQLPGDVIRWCEITKEGRTLYHGALWRWYRNGKRRAKEFYLEGKGDGEWASWYPNGKQSSLGFFTQGHKRGTWLYWNEKGRVTAEVTYSEHGDRWIAYYPASGKTRATGSANAGGKVGLWIHWDKKGKEIARCDFGKGLTSLPSKACRLIAETVEPVGYSRPMPTVTTNEETVTLMLDGDAITLPLPAGWRVRAQSQLPLVLEPAEGHASAIMRLRVVRKSGSRLETVVKKELARLREGVTRYVELGTKRVPLGRRVAITKQINYLRPIEPDSPRATVATTTTRAQFTFVDASDQMVLVAELACDTTRQLQEQGPALTALLAPFDQPPVVAVAATPAPEPGPVPPPQPPDPPSFPEVLEATR